MPSHTERVRKENCSTLLSLECEEGYPKRRPYNRQSLPWGFLLYRNPEKCVWTDRSVLLENSSRKKQKYSGGFRQVQKVNVNMMCHLRILFPLHFVVFNQTVCHLAAETNVEQVFLRSEQLSELNLDPDTLADISGIDNG